ncbi:MAG TPA: lysylphosphatidylglycerol synthase transmembrane domain-containing protein [Roseiflexaceae bacterium]|nr:lysylphosphatidylglycerol synthase transmembrane domain-containing protein [Roseiflexaceae bacterium]
MMNEPSDTFARSAEPHEAQESPTVVEVEREGFSLGRSLRNPRTIISFVLALAIILFIFRGLDINVAQTWSYIRKANGWLFLLGFLVFYATFPIRAFRWRILMKNAGIPVQEGRHSWASMPALLEYLYLSWFANCIVPAKLGDAYRGYLLKHNGGVSFSRTFGTIFTERLLDMIVLFALLVISAWSVFGASLPPNAKWVFALGLVLVIIIVMGLAAMRFLSPFIRRVVPQRVEPMYASFEAGTLGALKPRSFPLLFVLTSLVWLGESLRLFLVIEAMGGLSMRLPSVIFVALMGSLLTTIPATPGGLGVVEGGVTGVLSALFGIAAPVAAAVAVLDRVINYWSIVVGGLIVYVFSKRK